MKTIKVKSYKEIPFNFTGVVNFPNRIECYKDGNRHQEEGPAREYPNRTKYWYLESEEYKQINLKDHVILDYYQGKHKLMWYRLLDEDNILEYPDIPGLIKKYVNG